MAVCLRPASSRHLPRFHFLLSSPPLPLVPSFSHSFATTKKVSPSAKANQATSKAAKGKGGGEGRKKESVESLIEEALKDEKVATVKMDSEQAAMELAMAKEYSRKRMAMHRASSVGEVTRLKMKLAAIEALPEGKLRDAARVPDFSPFPTNRIAASLTPPMQGVLEDRARELENVAKVKKMR
eukprot:TRINITY_DN4327_c0_g1_i1.p1 TRINITY_DN4327_c0_g1~~TRINITY_DN4327_c0_g1_i1.p1  ORF type:complete len:183 (-),score=31.27 TRINITY_DN4327_c0_g1_i1:1028-1576(-)